MHVISSGSILHAIRAHSIIYFKERGELTKEGGLFAIFAYKGAYFAGV